MEAANAAPIMDADVSSARNLRARLIEIKMRVVELELQLASLHSEHDRVLEDLKSIVYPILTLPPEVTTNIFLCYSGSPLHLAAWRDIAHSTPRLWARFGDISPGTQRAHSLVALDRTVSFWLPRARNQPLTIRIKFSGDEAHESILWNLSLYSSQWSILALASDTRIYFPPSTMFRPLSSLARLELDLPPTGQAPPIASFVDAPHLREVSIKGLTLPDILLPWAQLIELTLIDQESLSSRLQYVLHPRPIPSFLDHLFQLQHQPPLVNTPEFCSTRRRCVPQKRGKFDVTGDLRRLYVHFVVC
ncbi:hypothetical protein B0H15DRAFT_863234 [Mycena belliarum]|uniref:F-box domain-containing protein n=1 Tax=Mycena belliarum TaxID=1033014 RepID=A0AAD6XNF0_9AGAR|nr:hypothetical protein B0H15DRAFT_863234 [Mycena belliae]